MTELSLLTGREAIEKAYADIEVEANRIDTLGDRATAEERAALAQSTETLATMLNDFEATEKTKGVQGRARALLDELSGIPTQPLTGPGSSSAWDALAAYTGIANPRGMTIGEAVVKSEAYEEFLAKSVTNGVVTGIGGQSRSIEFGVSFASRRSMNGLHFHDPDGKGARNLVTGGSETSGGALVEPQHLPGIVDNAMFRELTIWDLCTKEPITSDTFDYVEIDQKTNNAAFVAEATSAGGLASAAHPDAVTDVAGGLKPSSTLSMVVRTVTVENIAHMEYITRRAAADAPRLMSIINTFLREGLGIAIEDQILLGDGTSPNLRGLLNATNPYALSVFDMSVNGVTSRLAALLRAIGVVKSFRHRPNAMLINSDDWFGGDFLGLQDPTTGKFILADPAASAEQLSALWGLNVVVTDAVAAGTQVIGDFSKAVIGDRQQAALYMSDSNRDLFERNIITMLAEQRLGFGVKSPKAFCTVVA